MSENILERLHRESKGYVTLSPELVQREKETQLGYLMRLRKRLGREITEAEWHSLQNIL